MVLIRAATCTQPIAVETQSAGTPKPRSCFLFIVGPPGSLSEIDSGCNSTNSMQGTLFRRKGDRSMATFRRFFVILDVTVRAFRPLECAPMQCLGKSVPTQDSNSMRLASESLRRTESRRKVNPVGLRDRDQNNCGTVSQRRRLLANSFLTPNRNCVVLRRTFSWFLRSRLLRAQHRYPHQTIPVEIE